MNDKTTKYRSELKILVDVLNVMKQEQETKPTKILYRANLSHDRLNKYLEKLMSMGLVDEIIIESRAYMLTKKGHEFLKEFNKFAKFASAFGFIL